MKAPVGPASYFPEKKLIVIRRWVIDSPFIVFFLMEEILHSCDKELRGKEKYLDYANVYKRELHTKNVIISILKQILEEKGKDDPILTDQVEKTIKVFELSKESYQNR